MSFSTGNPASTVFDRLRNSPAITIDSPLPTSTVVSARRTLITGTVTPETTVIASLRDGSETSGRTVSTIRPESTTVGTKSSRTPYFL